MMPGEAGAAGGASPRFVHARDVLSRRSPGGVVVLAPAAAVADALHGTAADVWACFAEPRGLDETVAQLALRYETDPDRIAPDVAALVADLLVRGALEVAP